MARSPTEIRDIVSKKFGEEPEGTTEGPHRVGPYRITRVWTQDSDGEYHAHYLVEEGKKFEVYQNFSPFASWLVDGFDMDKSAARDEQQLRSGVATIIVLGAFALLVYLIVMKREDSIVFYILTTVVGGGAGFLFGNWSRRSSQAKSPPPAP